MTIRILHCGLSTENYDKCIENRVAGFKGIYPSEGDLVYLVVKVGGISLCGARGILGELSATRPWKDMSSYPNTRMLNHIEYCDPFDVSILKLVGGKHWSAKYFQSSKAIKEQQAIELLNNTFNNRHCESPIWFSK